MKKCLLSILFAFICTMSFAQTEHMKFKGLPLTGPLMSFVEKLKQKGYTYIGKQDGVACLSGEFAAVKKCTIGVATFNGKDQVNSVVVVFPEKKVWSEITSDYFGLKNLLSEKYGEPESVEFFPNGEPESDFLKFHAILNGECNYTSEFSTPNGKIQLSMKKMDVLSASVYLKYIDKANEQELKKKIMDDL